MKNTEKGGNGAFPVLVQVLIVLLVLGVIAYILLSGREKAQKEHDAKVHGIASEPAGKTIPKTAEPTKAVPSLGDGTEAKAKAKAKAEEEAKAKAKANTRARQNQKPAPAPTPKQKALEPAKVLSPDMASPLDSPSVKQQVEPNPLIEGVDKNYGKPNVEFIPTVEEKSTTKKRTIVVDDVTVVYGRHDRHGWDNYYYNRYNSGNYWNSSGSAYDTPAYVQGSVLPPPPPNRPQAIGVSGGVPVYSTPAYVQGSVIPPRATSGPIGGGGTQGSVNPSNPAP